MPYGSSVDPEMHDGFLYPVHESQTDQRPLVPSNEVHHTVRAACDLMNVERKHSAQLR